HEVTCVESGDKAPKYLGLMNCPVINESHVNVHHQHDDGDDSDEHEHGTGHGHDDGDSMMFPHSLSLVNAHDQQEGQGTRVNYRLLHARNEVKESSSKDVPVVVISSENVPLRIHMCLEGAEEFLLKPVRLSNLKEVKEKDESQPLPPKTSVPAYVAAGTAAPSNNGALSSDFCDDFTTKNMNKKQRKQSRREQILMQHKKPFNVGDYVWLNMKANGRMLSTKGPNSTMEEGHHSRWFTMK
ncbi:Two-component response regulator ARR9, partial [Bienertia sinuspersici]